MGRAKEAEGVELVGRAEDGEAGGWGQRRVERAQDGVVAGLDRGGGVEREEGGWWERGGVRAEGRGEVGGEDGGEG